MVIKLIRGFSTKVGSSYMELWITFCPMQNALLIMHDVNKKNAAEGMSFMWGTI